ncbi:MAG: hypothetical protein CME70_17425 [Halobacteriovorax sp.]|nr:hypothetical protein [Halobacteriovorax sp.]
MFKIIIISLLLLSGCSIFRHKDFISVDSFPRGLEVKKDGKLIGKTPLFHKARLSSSPEYNINGSLVSPIEKCGMQWTDPLVDKIPLFKTLVPDVLTKMMTTLTPINLVKGGKYECTALVRKKFKSESKKAQCRKFIIIPPPSERAATSFQISNDWIEENFKSKKSSCDEVIHPKVAKEHLEFFGLNHMNRSYGIKYMMYGLMARIGYKFNSTHLVYLYNENQTVTPHIYDIHTRLQNAKELETPFYTTAKDSKTNIVWDKFRQAFRLVPNSISLRFKLRRWLHLSPEENEKLFSRRISKVKLPPSIVMSNIEYPLDSWGTNFRFSPSLSYKSWDQDYEIKYASAMMVLKLFGHTPIGTFIGRLGAGVAYLDTAKLGGGYESKQGLAVAQWGGEYYKFLGERAFFKFGFRRNELRKNKVEDGLFHLKGISEIYAGLGFYFPEMNSKIRSFFYD